MLPKPSQNTQPSLFQPLLVDMLDTRDPLIALSDAIDWEEFEKAYAPLYSTEGRPAKPIRMMVGLLILKQVENLSDESVVVQYKRNPYYQYFCGKEVYTPSLPCDATELVKFRQRIGSDGIEQIFAVSVGLHGERAQEKRVIIDTTVQESNITYPTDGKLAIKIINHLHKIAKHENIKLRRSYIKEIKAHRITLRFFRHPKKIKKAKGAMKRLRTIAKTILRDIDRKFGDNMALHEKYAQSFYLFMRILLQTKHSPNKIYSLHAPHAYAINKGKDHKGWEYGTKASIVTTYNSGVIIGVATHEVNAHDSKTLQAALASARKNRTKPIKESMCDRGYRGIKEVDGIKICIPGNALKRDTPYIKKQKRKKFRRRAAIEPVIGHLKSDHRLNRNYLKGIEGDRINLLLSAAAFNFKKWMNDFLVLVFMFKLSILLSILHRIEPKERYRHALLYRMVYCLW